MKKKKKTDKMQQKAFFPQLLPKCFCELTVLHVFDYLG